MKVNFEWKNKQQTVNRITRSDAVRLEFAYTCERFMNPYVPMDTGMLSQNTTVEPGKVIYNAPYAHYMYTGIVYGQNFPIYKNGILDGFYSKKGVTKHPTGKQIQYNSAGRHPNGTSYWDKAMFTARKDDLARAMTRKLRSM